MFLAWQQTGLKDLKLNGLDFSFSVPSSSFELDKWGNEMSGHLLAKRIKEETEQAKELAKKLETVEVKLFVKMGENGKTFVF